MAEFEFFALSAQPTRQRLVHNETRLELLHGGILAVPIKGQSLVHVRRTLVGKGQQSIRIHVQKDFRLWKGGHDQGGRRESTPHRVQFFSFVDPGTCNTKKGKTRVALEGRCIPDQVRCALPSALDHPDAFVLHCGAERIPGIPRVNDVLANRRVAHNLRQGNPVRFDPRIVRHLNCRVCLTVFRIGSKLYGYPRPAVEVGHAPNRRARQEGPGCRRRRPGVPPAPDAGHGGQAVEGQEVAPAHGPAVRRRRHDLGGGGGSDIAARRARSDDRPPKPPDVHVAVRVPRPGEVRRPQGEDLGRQELDGEEGQGRQEGGAAAEPPPRPSPAVFCCHFI